MKVAFILPTVSDTHHREKIDVLKSMGCEVHVFAFSRPYYQGEFRDYTVYDLGEMSHNKYFSRAFLYISAIFKLRAINKTYNCVYVFGLDLLLLAWFTRVVNFKKYALVYEVPDIRNVVLKRNALGWWLRFLERFLIKRIYLLVVTSPAFLTGYYAGFLRRLPDKNLVIENKILAKSRPHYVSGHPPAVADLHREKVRIGYFGLLRCRKSLESLIEVARNSEGRVTVLLRGIFMGTEDLRNEIDSLDHISYGGEYVSPQDLPFLYDQIDVSWVCYPYSRESLGNWRWARTNRFYEACYFHKPMLALKNTEDGKVVDEFGIGQSLDLNRAVQDIAREIETLVREHIDLWNVNIKQVPENIYIFQDEHQHLLNELKIA
jgi:succinoglycan biosynthesis protein ExoL